MRVTNKMMTNNTLNNINRNKSIMSKLEGQYSTQKKIQRPSDDPIVAVRALKLRQNLNELNQYYERNIPDALSWMDTTEGALNNINEIYTKMYEQFNYGTSDSLTGEDRNSILENIIEMKRQIYQEGNTDYAGRYVLTGHKTDTSLVFDTNTTDYQYSITQNFKGSEIGIGHTVMNATKLSQYVPGTSTAATFATTPTTEQYYRIRLAYDNLTEPASGQINVNVTDAANTMTSHTATSYHSSEANAYVDDGSLHYIADTGELIIPQSLYNSMANAIDISLTYEKSSFENNELRPEHYFTCTKTNVATGKTHDYQALSQEIEYEINYGQKIVVNTQGKDALTHDLAREVEELAQAVNSIQSLETNMGEVKKKLSNINLSTTDKEALEALYKQMEMEHTLKSKILSDKFGAAMTLTSSCQDTMNVALADLGSRYNRVELVENRLSIQRTEFEELLSKNEDADLLETYTRYTSQQVAYNASLEAASKLVKNTLLDYI